MKSYLELLDDILTNGRWSDNRTGVKTIKVFDRTIRMNLSQGFPVLTTKRIHMKSVIGELLWFLSGSTNNNDLIDRGVTIWQEWATPQGHLGPIYGRQWRHFPAGNFFNTMSESELHAYIDEMAFDQKETLDKRIQETNLSDLDFYGILNNIGIDQVNEALRALRKSPNSRRILVNAWNPQVLPDESKCPQFNVFKGRQSLAPCHYSYQFITTPLTLKERMLYNDPSVLYVDGAHDEDSVIEILDVANVPKYKLNCSFTCRSQDCFLGTPFNLASYALLTNMVAQVVNMVPGELVWHGTDCHLYSNHIDQVKEQLTRTPRTLPTLRLNSDVKDLFKFTKDDISLVNYDPYPPIKAEVAV